MSSAYSLLLVFLFLLVSAGNMFLGYWAVTLLRGDALSVGERPAGEGFAGRMPRLLDFDWSQLTALLKIPAARKKQEAAPAAETAAIESTTGPAPLEGTSLCCLKLSETMATFCQSVYEQDLLLREFLENPGEPERAQQLADGGVKFLERHLKRFNQAAAKLEAIENDSPVWRAGKEAVQSALTSLLADANQAHDAFKSELEQGQPLAETLAKCMRVYVDRSLALRGALERGIDKMLRVDPGVARLPTETLEEKGKHLFGRAWLGARLAASFNRPKYHVATLHLSDLARLHEEQGYAVGAVLLEGVDKVLQENLKAGEWLFRLDGARWYLLLATPDTSSAAGRLDALRQKIASTRFEWSKKEFTLSARGALVASKEGDAFEPIENGLQKAILAPETQSAPLVLIEKGGIEPLQSTDLGLAPVTVTL